MKFCDEKKYDILVPTSMGVRLTPINSQPVYCSTNFKMQATSAETNVATIAASLSKKVIALTAFVKDSPISKFIKNDLRSRGFDIESCEFSQDSPWGVRHQFNIADSGYGLRGPRVYNDRAGEVGRLLDIDYFDIDKILKSGVKIIHLSGLICSLSAKTSEFCLKLAERAKQYDTKISFDLNYRESFWKNREKELRKVFLTIAENADILLGNEEDFQLCLGVEGPKSGGEELENKIDSFKKMIEKLKTQFKNAKVFGTTLREVCSVNKHLWGSIINVDNEWNVINPREINVLDRIGGGDGFVGGLLYALLQGFNVEKCNQFAWATGAIATTFETDYAIVADEKQVWDVYNGNARVRR